MIKIISDIGYCFGVKNAIKVLENASEKNSHVFLLHPLIHNSTENEILFKKYNLHLLSDDDYESGIKALVFSAHGHLKIDEERYKEKYNLYDATCPIILKRYELLSNPKDDTTYIFLGKNGHQETVGFLSHFPFLKFIDCQGNIFEQLEKIEFKEKIYVIPQTTISNLLLESCLTYLKIFATNIEKEEICPLYQKRLFQSINELRHITFEKSYFIVCGDINSSNSNEIFNAIKRNYPLLDGVIASTIEQIDINKLKEKDIYIASATSVSEETVNKLVSDITYLQQHIF